MHAGLKTARASLQGPLRDFPRPSSLSAAAHRCRTINDATRPEKVNQTRKGAKTGPDAPGGPVPRTWTGHSQGT